MCFHFFAVNSSKATLLFVSDATHLQKLLEPLNTELFHKQRRERH